MKLFTKQSFSIKLFILLLIFVPYSCKKADRLSEQKSQPEAFSKAHRPPQKQSEIKQHKKVMVCENCGRILVDEELNSNVEVK